MIRFGLITEGITDQVVISNILFGFFNNPDLVINELQPLRDETDRNKSSNYGGWGNLLEFCKSEVFKFSFQTLDYIIIQIDSDVCEEYDVPKIKNGVELTTEDLITLVKQKFVEIIGEEFYHICKKRIIFAISVHSIECWFLPIYYNDNKKSKIVSCLQTLNPTLYKKHGFTIDKYRASLKTHFFN